MLKPPKRERLERYADFNTLLFLLDLSETFTLIAANIDSLVAPVPKTFANTAEVAEYFAAC